MESRLSTLPAAFCGGCKPMGGLQTTHKHTIGAGTVRRKYAHDTCAQAHTHAPCKQKPEPRTRACTFTHTRTSPQGIVSAPRRAHTRGTHHRSPAAVHDPLHFVRSVQVGHIAGVQNVVDILQEGLLRQSGGERMKEGAGGEGGGGRGNRNTRVKWEYRGMREEKKVDN